MKNNKINLYFSLRDPLEQFDNTFLISEQYNCPSALTTITACYVTLSFILFSVSTIFIFNISSKNVLKLIYTYIESFVKSLVNDNSKTKKKTHISGFLFLFITLASINVSGLIPYSWTITSWFTPILLIGMSFLFQINCLIILRKKYSFFEQFVPSGTPIMIVPFLTIIEIISYGSRVISLSVRLFANMLSGHALLKILISFSWTMALKLTLVSLIVASFIWAGVTVIFMLEIMVALLQAYVFTLLLNIYLSDVFSEGH